MESLREELHHYETRLSKVQYLEAELSMVDERHGGEFADDESKTEGRKIMDKKLKKHMDIVDKTQRELEKKIAARHTEL